MGTAGCLDAFREHFQGSLRRPVPVRIFSEADRAFNVRLEAYDSRTDRQTYDEAYTVRPDERVNAPRLDAVAQRFRVTRFGGDGADDLVETGRITEETNLVAIRIYDDDLTLEISEREGEGTTNDTADGSTNDTADGTTGE